MEVDPFLSPDDFTILCNVVEALFRITSRHTPGTNGWSPMVDFRDPDVGTYLRFLRWFSISSVEPQVDNDQATLCESDEDQLSELDDDFDTETLRSVSRTEIDTPMKMSYVSEHQHYRMEYQIALSPSYRVPVLYLALLRTKKPVSIDLGGSITNLDMFLSIMGVEQPSAGLSLVDSPTNPHIRGHGCLSWMVHPCMTADALRDLLSMDELINNSAAEPSNYDLSGLAKLGDMAKVKYLARYFAGWLGLVGKYFRLDLPMAVARAIDQLHRTPEP